MANVKIKKGTCMSGNILWGFTLIMLGVSIIINKLYGIAIPFEVMLGLFLILLGINRLLNLKSNES